jgi:hypothetical protein
MSKVKYSINSDEGLDYFLFGTKDSPNEQLNDAITSTLYEKLRYFSRLASSQWGDGDDYVETCSFFDIWRRLLMPYNRHRIVSIRKNTDVSRVFELQYSTDIWSGIKYLLTTGHLPGSFSILDHSSCADEAVKKSGGSTR